MNPTARTLLAGSAAAALATVAKTKAEATLQPLAEKLLPPTPAQKTEIGADPAGHPENMPPSELADRAQHAVTGRELRDDQRLKAAGVLHWAMGMGFGLAYALVARRIPAVRAGRGTLGGAALFASTHASLLPATGMQHPLSELPKAWWIWEGGSHLCFGAVLDLGLTAGDAALRRVG